MEERTFNGVRRVVGSITRVGSIEVFFVPASVSNWVYQKPCYVLSLDAKRKELPMNWRHITVNYIYVCVCARARVLRASLYKTCPCFLPCLNFKLVFEITSSQLTAFRLPNGLSAR